MYFSADTASLMRRLCFLLLAFLFPLQLFAGTLESIAADTGAHAALVCSAETQQHAPALPLSADRADTGADAASIDHDQHPDSKQLKAQADLEDQTLPASFATLPLDWHPFPHLYPHVSDGTSAFIDLQRPPPSV